ncbi:AI-2E family transporter [Notoacmeibacter ruber]|uniref:AI-2E family transporter n=1 Tax=Notoacmeibacter ruber TaxID=2670375 RepID=UPI0013142D6C|nr:AI-2E family transporter [Notoacmeibacter ruber]
MAVSENNADSIRNRLLAFIAVILGVTALRYGYSFLMPAFVAAFIIAAAWPLRDWFCERLPSTVLAYAATILTLFLLMLAFFGIVFFSLGRVAMSLADNQESFRTLYDRLMEYANAHNIPVPFLSDDESSGYDRLATMARSFLAALYAVVTYLGLISVIVILGFPEVPALARRVSQQYREGREELFETAAAIASSFRSYLLMTLIASLITGVCSTLLSFAFGLELALTWGVLNFMLNFVPVVGNIIGIIPPALYAVVQFGGWQMPLAIFVAFGLMQIIISNFAYPWLQSKGVSLPAVIIVLSLLFWSWCWGMVGSLFAVPLTTMSLIILWHFDASRREARIVSGDKIDEEAQNKKGEQD